MNSNIAHASFSCHIITNPPYKTMEPSENDCLLIWAHLFSLISDDIELLSGERMLEASKAVRREQSQEYGDLTEAGRKVDLAFCYSGIELSNIEFKRAGIPLKDITRQCRKNVRLGRCLQEFHRTIGMNDLSVIMADITGIRNMTIGGDKHCYSILTLFASAILYSSM
jgi:hypothetical protein